MWWGGRGRLLGVAGRYDVNCNRMHGVPRPMRPHTQRNSISTVCVPWSYLAHVSPRLRSTAAPPCSWPWPWPWPAPLYWSLSGSMACMHLLVGALKVRMSIVAGYVAQHLTTAAR